MSRKKSTRQLIGIDDIKNDSVVTADGELTFYFVHPSNLNVLPEQGVRAKVRELLGVLKGMAELELLALDSKESFQDNRQFYRQRLEEEDMPAIRGLLVQDRQHLDSVQTTMASSREFCFVLRRRKTDGTMNYASLGAKPARGWVPSCGCRRLLRCRHLLCLCAIRRCRARGCCGLL